LFFKYSSCTQNNTEKKNKGFKIEPRALSGEPWALSR